MRYDESVPEFPSSTFLERFVDFPFDIADRYATLNDEAKLVLRDDDVAFIRDWDDALRDALHQPATFEEHIIGTRDAVRRARASISAETSVPTEVKPIIIHGLDAGWFQAALTNPKATGHLPKPVLLAIRHDFKDDESFELFRLVLDARYAPQMADEALHTAPEWIRQKYLPLFYSRQAVLTMAMSMPFPNAEAWRKRRKQLAWELRRQEERARVRAEWLPYWLSVTEALFDRQPLLARQLRSTSKEEVAAVVEKVVTMRSSVDPHTGEHYSYRQILHAFGRPVQREEINMEAHKQLVILNQIIDGLRADEANVRRDQALGLLLEIHDESRSATPIHD
jgi:hypothetical protein